MKSNHITSNRPRAILLGLAALLGLAVLLGLFVGFSKLREIYLEQCVIRDVTTQVSISSGKLIKAQLLAESFGLTNGANLATIDFERRRAEILKKIPTLKSITISRQLPNQLTIVAEERTPIAKLGVRGAREMSGRVVDDEGMVFPCRIGIRLLPTIVEPNAPGTPIGRPLSGHARAALQLLEACRQPDFSELAIQAIDISHPDFLLATLGNYSKAKIAWEGMGGDAPAARTLLENLLTQLLQAIRSQVLPNTKIWNATIPDKIFANQQ